MSRVLAILIFISLIYDYSTILALPKGDAVAWVLASIIFLKFILAIGLMLRSTVARRILIAVYLVSMLFAMGEIGDINKGISEINNFTYEENMQLLTEERKYHEVFGETVSAEAFTVTEEEFEKAKEEKLTDFRFSRNYEVAGIIVYLLFIAGLIYDDRRRGE